MYDIINLYDLYIECIWFVPEDRILLEFLIYI